MLKNRRIRALIGILSAGTVFLSALATPISNLTGNPSLIFAGEQLGENDFESGAGLPWHICESETGVMDFEISGGVYKITIVNPGGCSNGGEDRWDCQFRHRGLKIDAGHQYKISYTMTASKSGQYYTKIGSLDGKTEVWHSNTNQGDFGSNWGMLQISEGETKKVEMTFTPTESLDVAEWAFHLGGDGEYTNGVCFPAGTEITFDNMSLVDLTSDDNDYVFAEEWKRNDILVNQLGYYTKSVKRATLISDENKPIDFELCDKDGKTVFEGESEPMGKDKDSGDSVHILDFSDFDKSGEGYYLTAGSSESLKFAVGEELYADILYDSLNYFYQNRSGIEIESEYISSGEAKSLARAAGHNPDKCKTELVWGYKDSYELDVTGGWYDAGDHGKYVVNGGISVWTMQNQYERALNAEKANADLYGDGTMNIPESGNGVPDILDEARYNLEFMLSMMVPDNYDYAGMVHHKVHDEKWTGLAVAPADDDKERIIKPPTTAATLNFAACAAQAARLWKNYDEDFAKECLEAAEKAYAAAEKNPKMYAPLDEAVGGGAYGDDNVEDEFYWAASELYITTGEKDYYSDMEDSEHFLELTTELSGGEDSDTTGSFNWGNTASLGTLSIAASKNSLSDKEKETVKDNIIKASEFYIELEEEQGYGVPMKQCTVAVEDDEIQGYPWGSNSFVVNAAIVMGYAYDLTGDEEHLNGVIQAMDYIMGRNPLEISYVTGYGSHSAKNPHHRWWSNQVDKEFPSAPSGVLVGGPNSGLQDPWVKGMGWNAGDMEPQLCYMDHIESWSTNECTINWNAPLAWVAGFLTNDGGRKTVQTSTTSKDDSSKANESSSEDKKKVDDSKDDDKDKKITSVVDSNDEKGIYDKAKDIFAIIGAAVMALFALVGLFTIIKGIIKSALRNKKAKNAPVVQQNPPIDTDKKQD